MVPTTELFYKSPQYVEFPGNVEGFYFFEEDVLSDAVITEPVVFRSLWCEIFWLVHAGVVVGVVFSWKGEVYVWQV